MRIWILSDSHTKHEELEVPEGIDLVIYAGDAGASPQLERNHLDLLDFFRWFAQINAKYKLYIPGNHDTSVEHGMHTKDSIAEYGITMLIDETIEIEGIKIFGSPFTPEFGASCWAYNAKRGNSIRKHWAKIEDGTDIIVTHGPVKGMLDRTSQGIQAGCGDLAQVIQFIAPKYHIGGHIHEEGGKTATSYKYPDTTFINSSVVNLYHEVQNHGHIIEI